VVLGLGRDDRELGLERVLSSVDFRRSAAEQDDEAGLVRQGGGGGSLILLF